MIGCKFKLCICGFGNLDQFLNFYNILYVVYLWFLEFGTPKKVVWNLRNYCMLCFTALDKLMYSLFMVG